MIWYNTYISSLPGHNIYDYDMIVSYNKMLSTKRNPPVFIPFSIVVPGNSNNQNGTQ